MKSPRPYSRARSDRNHSIVTKALKNWGGGFSCDEFGVWQGYVHGLPVAAYDVSKLGGEMSDWIVAVSWMVIALEVKKQRPPDRDERKNKQGRNRNLDDEQYYWSQLEPGEEAFFLHSPMVKFIVATEENVWTKIIAAVEFVEYVDGLHFKGEPFTNLFFPKLREETNEQQFSKSFEH